jgi:hypothetical protein
VVNAKIIIENPPVEILPNYSFTGKIEISPSVTVLLVERQAIGYENGRAYAERIDGKGRSEQLFADVEPYGDTFVKIISGLNRGDTLKALQSAAVTGRGGPGGGPSGRPVGGTRGGPSGGPPPPGF